MYFDVRNLVPGTKYVIMMTGVVRPLVAECTNDKSRRGVCILKVLNAGELHGVLLSHEDYIVDEIYDEAKHGIIEPRV